MKPIAQTVFPLGGGSWAGLACSPLGLRALLLPASSPQAVAGRLAAQFGPLPEQPAAFGETPELLRRFWASEKVVFSAPLDWDEATGFQRAVWTALLSISWGERRSYGWVAAAIGRPRAMRAVGQAVGANPLPIIVPCHRVVASDGSLHGYSGGLEMKKRLLARERGIALRSFHRTTGKPP
ncbi:MAG: methylated-DNA--[protein]-cysteine S-methyltransferase [Chloroflexi bacterium]|nr:methylated-DNA--[protein]-cysteine S-methyltransferase [Chloroflexota bacterium]